MIFHPTFFLVTYSSLNEHLVKIGHRDTQLRVLCLSSGKVGHDVHVQYGLAVSGGAMGVSAKLVHPSGAKKGIL